MGLRFSPPDVRRSYTDKIYIFAGYDGNNRVNDFWQYDTEHEADWHAADWKHWGMSEDRQVVVFGWRFQRSKIFCSKSCWGLHHNMILLGHRAPHRN